MLLRLREVFRKPRQAGGVWLDYLVLCLVIVLAVLCILLFLGPMR
jgi:hypothetical protein